MRTITNVMIVFCEFELWLAMCFLTWISGVLMKLMHWVADACAILHEEIQQLSMELYR